MLIKQLLNLKLNVLRLVIAADHIIGYNLFKYSCQINSGQNLFIFTSPEFPTSPVGQCIKNNIGNDEKA